MNEKIFSVSRISFLLGVRNETVKLWIKNGKLKAIGTEGDAKWNVNEEALKTFLENNPKYIRDYFQNKKKLEPDVVEIPREVAEDMYKIISVLKELGGRRSIYLEHHLRKALKKDEET